MYRLRTAAALASCVGVLVLVGCSSEPGQAATGTSTTTAARAQQWSPNESTSAERTRAPATVPQQAPTQIAGVDRSDSAAVADAVVTTWFAWNTVTDAGPNDAAARTGVLLTERFRADAVGTTPTGSPGGQWLAWAADGAQIWPTVSSVPNQGAKDTDEVVHRMYQVEQTAIAADGSIAGVDTQVVAVLVVKESGQWSVDAVRQL